MVQYRDIVTGPITTVCKTTETDRSSHLLWYLQSHSQLVYFLQRLILVIAGNRRSSLQNVTSLEASQNSDGIQEYLHIWSSGACHSARRIAEAECLLSPAAPITSSKVKALSFPCFTLLVNRDRLLELASYVRYGFVPPGNTDTSPSSQVLSQLRDWVPHASQAICNHGSEGRLDTPADSSR